MSALRVQAPDGRTGTLDDDGNFTPDPVAAPTVPHRSTPGPNFDPAQAVEGEDQLQAAPAGIASAVARFNANLAKNAPAIATAEINAVPFGLGPKLAGVAAHAMGAPDSITQKDFGAAAQQLSEEHPGAALAGKGVALAGELATGEAAGAALSGGARLLPSVASRVGRFTESAPILASAAKAAAGGAAYGAAGGAGEAASKGEDVGQAAKTGAEYGAATGAVLGTVAGKLGKLLKEAPASYEDEFARDFIGASVKKDKKAFGQILNKEAETNVDPDAASKYLRSTDLRPVRDALVSKDYGTALERAQEATKPLLEDRLADYAQVTKTTGGVEVGQPYQALRKALFEAENGAKKDPVAADALSKELERWKTTYTSAPTQTVKDALGRQAAQYAEDSPIGKAFQDVADRLPDAQKRVTRTMLADALKYAPEQVREFVDSKVISKNTGIMTWDPSARMPTVEFRDAVSAAQKNAVSALGTFNPTDAGLRKEAVKVPLNATLERHLDEAAAKGDQAVVDRIRRRGVKLSLLASIKQGIERARTEAQTARYAVPLHQRIASASSHALGATPGLYEALHDVKNGRYEDIPKDIALGVGGALAARAAVPLVEKAVTAPVRALQASATNGILSRLQVAAANGNSRAAGLLRSLQNAGARGSAAIGSAVSGTLANQDDQQ